MHRLVGVDVIAYRTVLEFIEAVFGA